MRLAYINWQYWCNVGGGVPSGPAIDLTNEVMRRLGQTVEWERELYWGNFVSEVASGASDMMGVPLWLTENRAKALMHSTPLLYDMVHAWGTPDGQAAGKSIIGLNSPSLRCAVIKGEMSEFIVSEFFQRCQQYLLPDNSPLEDVLWSVLNNKADICFYDSYRANRFMKETGKQLVCLTPNRPLRAPPVVYYFNEKHAGLADKINAIIDEMASDGATDKILASHQFFHKDGVSTFQVSGMAI